MMENEIRTLPILLVDDETQVLMLFSSMLKSSGITNLITLDDSRQVMPLLAKNPVSLVLTDISMPFLSGKDLLIKIKQEYPEIPVIILTALRDIEIAVECMKNGASDYLVKPVERNRLVSSIEKALEIIALQNQVSSLKHYLLSRELKNKNAFIHFITASSKIHSIFQYVESIADSPLPILITGETGVGKELIAKSIHLCSKNSKDFISVNVAGLDDNMFSDTLFGHRKGAFTGADSQREGLILQAAGGTLFLDEIGDLSPQSQVKLLRLIQEREYYPLGMDTCKTTDARIICATNHDLKQMVQEGQYRKDLYFRLSAHHIYIPPLRERPEDIPELLLYFLDDAAKKMNKKKPTPPTELIQWLSTYNFPGNVRELQSMVFDAVSQHRSGILSMESFKKSITGHDIDSMINAASKSEETKILNEFFVGFPTLKRAEKYLIEQALTKAEGNQGLAASMLGISRQALNRRLSRKKNK